MARASSRIVGIDLGTTHTVVAWADVHAPDRIEVFSVPQLVTATEIEPRPLLPSCLYAAGQDELVADPWDESPWSVGEFARRRGSEVPGRFVVSAKSWLGYGAVDRTAPILPWGAKDEAADEEEGAEAPRISPVDASARYLAHVRRTYDLAYPDAPLAEQSIVLTVPASFDEAARELTLLAAERAGLSVRLLEEPQAALYDWIARAAARGGATAQAPAYDGPRDSLQLLLPPGADEGYVLVCDVGGGTTDMSLVRARRPPHPGEPPLLERVAVGDHILLGGDNMDLALAHLAESRILASAHVEPGAAGGSGASPAERLSAGRFAQLVQACRSAKETLLGADPPESATVTVLGRGARLFAGALSVKLERGEVETALLDGFFPLVGGDARPRRGRSALVAFGLPYERDPAITRHIAAFLATHTPASSSAPGAAPGAVQPAFAPHAVLLNGGVFKSPRIAARIAQALGAFRGADVTVLPQADPDLAVARGAVAYGLSRLGRGTKIESATARAYFIGLGRAARDERPAAADDPLAVCVVPRGVREGELSRVADRPFALTVGRPVRFDLYASQDATSFRAGEIVTVAHANLRRLPPVATAFDAAAEALGHAAEKGPPRPAAGKEVEVTLEGELTPIGTLELACVEKGGRRHRLAFQLRETVAEDRSAPSDHPAQSERPPPAPRAGSAVAAAIAAIDRVFGRSRADVPTREVKELLRELERLLGERSAWPLPTIRPLADALLERAKARRRSPEHERLYWLLAGFAIRPGFGDPADPARVARLFQLFSERLGFDDQTRNWQQFWIAWRRAAGGLDEQAQIAIRDATDPLLAPSERRLKRVKGFKPEALDDLLEMSSSLERVPPSRRAELGSWVLERTWTDRDPRLRAALGRLGARVPAYASTHYVIGPHTAERWLEHLLRERWDGEPAVMLAASQIARATGDRARDISDRVRSEVVRKLVAGGAREAWIAAVREPLATSESDRSQFFGEALPPGLRIAGEISDGAGVSEQKVM